MTTTHDTAQASLEALEAKHASWTQKRDQIVNARADLQRSRSRVPGAKDRGNPYEGGKALPGTEKKQPRGGNNYGIPESVASSILPDSVVQQVRGNAEAIRKEFSPPAWQPVVGSTDIAFNLVQTTIHDHIALAGTHLNEVVDLSIRRVRQLMQWIESLNNDIGGIRSIPGGGSTGGGGGGTGGTYTAPIYSAPIATPPPRPRPQYSASQSGNTRNVNIAPGAIVINAPNADAYEVGRSVGWVGFAQFLGAAFAIGVVLSIGFRIAGN